MTDHPIRQYPDERRETAEADMLAVHPPEPESDDPTACSGEEGFCPEHGFHRHSLKQPGEPEDDTPLELTADEARQLADELGLDLYRAQDALAFVEECCAIADREGRTITTADVREWLKGAHCGRQLVAGGQLAIDPAAPPVHLVTWTGAANNGEESPRTTPDNAAAVLQTIAAELPGHYRPHQNTQYCACGLWASDLGAHRADIVRHIVEPALNQLHAALEQHRQRAGQVEELLAIAHETSNRSETERARLAAEVERLGDWYRSASERITTTEAERDRYHQELAVNEADRVATLRDLKQAQAAIERVRAVLPFAERVIATSGPGPASAVQAVLDRLCDALGQPAPGNSAHVYLSTGCFHGDHDYCRSITGLAGAKRPAECKKCGARCICPCHTAPGPAATEATGGTNHAG
jgi:hypothetical protein